MKLTVGAEPQLTGSQIFRRAGAALLAATLLFSLTPTNEARAATDIELGGRVYVDLNKDGYVSSSDEMMFNPDGVSVQLYKAVDSDFVPEGAPQVPSQHGNSAGKFLFTSLEPDVTYKVKPIVTNPQVGITPSALDSEGFLKYSGEYMEENNPWDSYNYYGLSEFTLGEGTDQSPVLRDLRLPLTAITTFAGTVVLNDVAGQAINPLTNAEAAQLVQGVSVTLKRGTRPPVKTTTDTHGRFEFKDLTNVVPGYYTIEFAQPAGRKLSASDDNDAALFSGGQNGAIGVFKLNTPTPGVDLTELNAYYNTKPTLESTFWGATAANGTTVNPKAAVLSSDSSSSTVVAFKWELLDDTQSVISSGETPGASGTINIPSSLSDRGHQVVATAVDLFGHTSDPVTTSFLVDTTAPLITSTVASVTQSSSGGTPPTDAAGWIALFGAAVSDGDGVGVSSAGITVDASAVTTDPGTYGVIFRAEDAIGLAAIPLVVTYTVPATAVPSLVIANPSVNHEMGSALPDDAGWIELFQVSATATPPASSITGITVDASAVKANLEGDYTVSFFATDNLGAVSKVQSGTVSIHDTTGPTLVLGTPEVTIPRDGSHIPPNDTAAWIALFGATATDAGSGMPTTGTLGLTVDASAVNYAAAGSYPVVFTATDESGVSSTTTGTLIIKRADAPSMDFTTPSASYEMGSAPLATTDEEWKLLFGANATSAPGTSVASLDVDASDVDYSKPGSYLVWFTVTDSDNTESRFFTTVVVQDSTAPVLTVGSEKQTFKKGDAKVSDAAGWIALFEAKGHDDGSGMPSVQPYGITVDASAVNYNRAGLYEVTFAATDSSGNVSKSVTVMYEVSFVDPVVGTPDTKPVVQPDLGSGSGTGTNTPGLGSPTAGQVQLANTGASTEGLPLVLAASGAFLLLAAALLLARRARRTA